MSLFRSHSIRWLLLAQSILPIPLIEVGQTKSKQKKGPPLPTPKVPKSRARRCLHSHKSATVSHSCSGNHFSGIPNFYFFFLNCSIQFSVSLGFLYLIYDLLTRGFDAAFRAYAHLHFFFYFHYCFLIFLHAACEFFYYWELWLIFIASFFFFSVNYIYSMYLPEKA